VVVVDWRCITKSSELISALFKGHASNPCRSIIIITAIIVSANRYIATATLAITALFLEYLRQFLIDLHQIYRHSSVPKNTSPCIFGAS